MAATVLADRQHNGFTFGGAGSITPAIDDLVGLADVSASDAQSDATIRDIQWEYSKVAHRYGFATFHDFEQQVSNNIVDNGLFNTSSFGSSASITNDIQGRVGLNQQSTGTNAAGRTAIHSDLSCIRLGGGIWFYETAFNIATLSTSSERYQWLVGFIDTATAANQVDGAYVLYDEGGVSSGSTAAAYFQSVTSSNSTRTFNSSHTQNTVSASTWYRIGVEVNADASSVSFYKDGTSFATHTANIPSASGRSLGFGMLLIKSVGTTARTIDVDYIACCCKFTSAR